MPTTKQLRSYLNAGKTLTLLNSKKRAIVDDWRNTIVDKQTLYRHRFNVAWVIGQNDLVIDVDIKRDGLSSFEKLQSDIGHKFTPTVNTPSGGFHVYLSISWPQDNPSKIKKSLSSRYPGIDFLSFGSYCLIAGCKTKQGSYFWQDNLVDMDNYPSCPSKLLTMLAKPRPTNQSEHKIIPDSFEDLVEQRFAMHQDDVNALLGKLDPSMEYNQWIRVGMALHSWNKYEQGLDLWELWSRDGDNYDAGACAKHWDTFTSDGLSHITLGTVMHYGKVADYDKSADELQHYLDRIRSATERDIELEIVPDLRKCSFNDIDFQKLIGAIGSRYKVLIGVRPSQSSIRNMIRPVNMNDDAHELVGLDEAPQWCRHWVYISSHSKYCHIGRLSLHGPAEFNLLHGHQIPLGRNSIKMSATKFVADSSFIGVADVLAYRPDREERTFEESNQRIVNCFNHDGLPHPALIFKPNGIKAIDILKRHILFICNDEDNASILTQWLAWQIQRKGQKLRWSPLIQSIQGTGKTYFSELLRECIGYHNVGVVPSSQVSSSFNSWASDVCVNVLEELKVVGHNRHEVVNSLKPLITDKFIQINRKGVAQYMTRNTTNYICFTNFKDAIPLSDTDRRWWIVFTDIESISDLQYIVGQNKEEYFTQLYGMTRRYSADILKWLSEYEITEKFAKMTEAPMTADKLSMIATEEAGIVGLFELKAIIAIGGVYFNTTVISSVDLFEEFFRKHLECDIGVSGKVQLLKRLGFSRMPKRINIDGKLRTIWLKKKMTNKEIRRSFRRNDLLRTSQLDQK